jgi:hypothetical protein
MSLSSEGSMSSASRKLASTCRPANGRNSRAQVEHLAPVLDAVVRPAPPADAREAVAALDDRAAIEHDRVCGAISQRRTAGRHSAAVAADVPADRDEGVVTLEDVREAELAPDLPEAGVDIEKDAPPGGCEQLGRAVSSLSPPSIACWSRSTTVTSNRS